MNRLVAVTLIALASCVQSTGGQLIEFNATASGPEDAFAGQPYTFTSAADYSVTLTVAKLFVGAVYLNQSNPANYTGETACILPGIYSGEVKGSLLIDALDPRPQPFDVKGVGTDAPTLAGELWLTAGDVNANNEQTHVLFVEGTASKNGTSYPFTASFTIGANRRVPASDALPGSNPLCKQRIVSPIATTLTLSQGGTLNLRIRPKKWFESVEFSQLAQNLDAPGSYVFTNAQTSRQPDIALYEGFRANSGPYEFSFRPGR